jgi:hypothetical protein
MKYSITVLGFGLIFFLITQVTPSPAISANTGPKRNLVSASPQAILFRRSPRDPLSAGNPDSALQDAAASIQGQDLASGEQIRVVQFQGPVKNAWVHALRATGCKIVGYVPNNAYLIWGTRDQIAAASRMDLGLHADEPHPIRWMGSFDPVLKIDPLYQDADLVNPDSSIAAVEIELIDVPEAVADIEKISSLAIKEIASRRRFMHFQVLSVSIPISRLLEVASLPEVLFIGPALSPSLLDERSSQIMAANLTSDRTQPIGPGYSQWLTSEGLDSPPNFVVDFDDTGLDRGSASPAVLHPDFLNGQGQSRVAYMMNYADDGEDDDRRGHGTLVASIAGGFPNITTQDPQEYFLGLGVAPNMMFGISRIFDSSGNLSTQFSFSDVVSAAYAANARISNDSWGEYDNSYDSLTQETDSLVRDAQPATPGNQEMTLVFAAGNFGPGGTINSPGTGKNVITVGASANYRPNSFDTCVFKGATTGIGPAGSESALDVSSYSSGGPTTDGRAKPDIVAPGTHIYGAESQSPFYNASGLCPGFPDYNTTPQYYTMSSGTSLATPQITGAAALLRQYMTAHNLLPGGSPPSPAMIKAYLVNSASYLTGTNAGGDLPGVQQGWGLVDLGTAFDDAHRLLVDETTLFTESGQTYQVQGSLADSSLPLRMTLAWTDAPGTLAAAPWVNNLDLELSANGQVFYGNNFSGQFSVSGGSPDTKNNLESIYLPPSTFPPGFQGNFTITVRATNIAGDGVPGNATDLDQDFALVVYNIAPPVPPPPSITSATYVGKVLTVTGQNFTSAAQVQINGESLSGAFAFNSATNSLSIKAKPAKLGLKRKFANQIIVIQGQTSSAPFVLQL